MFLKKSIRRIVTGLTLTQEYLCIGKEDLISPLKVLLLQSDPSVEHEVTDTHLFLGYRPVIIGFFAGPENVLHGQLKTATGITMQFVARHQQANQKIIATLMLRKVSEKRLGEKTLFLFEATRGKHHFLNFFHQAAGRGLERIRKRRPGNVDLPGNLYDQVRIAYSVPRTISVITVGEESSMNMFPTDLHGTAGEHYYTGSLRIGGLANDQVEKYKKIVVSEVDAPWYTNAYALGKNHMRPMADSSHFSLSPFRSERFKVPLPEGVIRYRELIQLDAVDIGIHRIHFYEVVNRQAVRTSSHTLAHVHLYYAQWRRNQGLSTPWLIR